MKWLLQIIDECFEDLCSYAGNVSSAIVCFDDKNILYLLKLCHCAVDDAVHPLWKEINSKGVLQPKRRCFQLKLFSSRSNS